MEAADYTLWANGFGMMVSTPETNAPATVPEPSTFVLATIGLIGLSAFHRRRRR